METIYSVEKERKGKTGSEIDNDVIWKISQWKQWFHVIMNGNWLILEDMTWSEWYGMKMKNYGGYEYLFIPIPYHSCHFIFYNISQFSFFITLNHCFRYEIFDQFSSLSSLEERLTSDISRNNIEFRESFE